MIFLNLSKKGKKMKLEMSVSSEKKYFHYLIRRYGKDRAKEFLKLKRKSQNS